MTKQEAARLVALLVASFPNSSFTEANAGAYELFFEQYEADAMAAAIRSLVGSAKFLPALAEIRQAVELASRPGRSTCPRCHVKDLNGRPVISDGQCQVCGWQRKELVS